MSIGIQCSLNHAATTAFLESLSQSGYDTTIQFVCEVSGPIEKPVITLVVSDPQMIVFDLLKAQSKRSTLTPQEK